MSRVEAINKAKELEESCRLAYSISQEFFRELLGDYATRIQILKSISDSYPWERVLEIQDRQQELDALEFSISDKEFEEYAFLLALEDRLFKILCRRITND